MHHAAGGVLHLAQARRRAGKIRIDQHRNAGDFRQRLAQQGKPLQVERKGEHGHAAQIASRPMEARDQAEADRVAVEKEDDRGGRGCRLGGHHRRLAAGCDDGDLALDELGGERRQSIVAAARPAIDDGEVAAFDKSRLLEAEPERVEVRRERFGRSAAEKSDHRHRRLLRARRERPSRRAADEHDEAAALHVGHRLSSGPSSGLPPLPLRREAMSQSIP